MSSEQPTQIENVRYFKKYACAHTSGKRAGRRRGLHGARGPLSPCVGSTKMRARCGCGCECDRGGYCGRRDSRGSAAAATGRIERRDAVGSNHARLRRWVKRRRLNVSLCLGLGLGLELGLGLGLRKK